MYLRDCNRIQSGVLFPVIPDEASVVNAAVDGGLLSVEEAHYRLFEFFI
jgi:hypothetical protein